jgi:hypothetical protein
MESRFILDREREERCPSTLSLLLRRCPQSKMKSHAFAEGGFNAKQLLCSTVDSMDGLPVEVKEQLQTAKVREMQFCCLGAHACSL